MNRALPAHPADWALPLPDQEYFSFLIDAIASAQQSISASMFIVDPRLYHDRELRVRDLLDTLEEAHWRRVEVRLLIGDSAQSTEIFIANRTATLYCQERGLDVRQADLEQQSSHSKFVLIDQDLAIVGSHNWTHDAMTSSREDSIAVKSSDLAISLQREFDQRWATMSIEEHDHVC